MTDDRAFQAGKDSELETSAEVSANDKYVLRLFVSGQSPRSILAIENMRNWRLRQADCWRIRNIKASSVMASP